MFTYATQTISISIEYLHGKYRQPDSKWNILSKLTFTEPKTKNEMEDEKKKRNVGHLN